MAPSPIPITSDEVLRHDRITGSRSARNKRISPPVSRRGRKILAGQREHFVGHVQAVSFAGGADAFGGKNDVNAAPRAEIQNGFAGLQLSEGPGLPQPSEAATAFSGNAPFSASV